MLLYSVFYIQTIPPNSVTLNYSLIFKEKCFRQKLYGIQKDVLCSYVYHLAMTLKRPVKVTLKFLNRCLHISLLILVANIRKFSKHY